MPLGWGLASVHSQPPGLSGVTGAAPRALPGLDDLGLGDLVGLELVELLVARLEGDSDFSAGDASAIAAPSSTAR